MKFARTSTVAAAFAVIFAFAVTTASAQKVGGYKPIDRSNAAVQSAAVFAVGAQGAKDGSTIELNAVLEAESQVVAGTNYRMCLKVTASGEEEDEADIITVRVVVYRNLKGIYSLTSWKVEECGADADEN